MPELPEVEIVKRGLEPALLNKKIKALTLNRPDLRTPITPSLPKSMENQSLTQLIRRGKYILGFNAAGHGFVLHLGMSGRIHIYKSGETYEPAKHDHVVFEIEDGGRVVFNDPRRFGMLYAITAANWSAETPFSAMGPEPLGNDFSGPALQEALKNRRGPIKTALLDQKVVAGVGNIYACEALFEAGISPLRPANALNNNEYETLAARIRDVLNRAIAAGGSSLRDYQHTDGTLGYFQHEFAVYDQEGKTCKHCAPQHSDEGCILRITQGGRSTFYCPVTQK